MINMITADYFPGYLPVLPDDTADTLAKKGAATGTPAFPLVIGQLLA